MTRPDMSIKVVIIPRYANRGQGAMCQWHMFSTDRSGAEKWECVARNNPQASKSGAFDSNIVLS